MIATSGSLSEEVDRAVQGSVLTLSFGIAVYMMIHMLYELFWGPALSSCEGVKTFLVDLGRVGVSFVSWRVALTHAWRLTVLLTEGMVKCRGKQEVNLKLGIL